MAEDVNFDKYPAQTMFPGYGVYSSNIYKTLRGDALQPALYIGDHNESYLALDYSGIHNV